MNPELAVYLRSPGRRARAARALACALAAACAGTPPLVARDLADMSLEELMNETVTSVSKREQKLADTAAAVTVLTNDDLRRSGATSVADALRLVPGMNVASVDSSQWAVSARGFNNVFANKLLVLVDGRAVYSPLFAGVHWDSVQPLLADVDRIEVIRGPGATVWGANAVNGVINVVTRDARDTQGGLFYSSTGDVIDHDHGVRYGGRLGGKTYYRVSAGAFAKDDYRLPDGRPAGDAWQSRRGELRVDHHPDENTQLTWLVGGSDITREDDVFDIHTAHTLARLVQRRSDRSGFEVQAYFDSMARDESFRANTRVDTADLSAQHTFGLGERHDVIWGFGYRFSDITAEPASFSTLVRNDEVETHLYSFFVQDEFQVLPDRLVLTAGIKAEHNDYTGLELQPGVRAVFKPTARQTLWAAVSRAVRTPSALEGGDIFGIIAGPPFPGPGGVYVPRLVGNDDFASEELTAYEIGYRVQPADRVSFDLALFYNDYEKLLSTGGIVGFVPGAPIGTAEMPFVNGPGGVTRGGEVSATVSPTDSWRLGASYSLLLVDLAGTSPGNPYLRSSPRNQVVLRSSHDLTRRLSLDGQLRYTDTIQSVPSYITADLRISYRPNDSLELALVGQNLLQDQHPEQAPFFLTSTSEVPRGFHGKLIWRF